MRSLNVVILGKIDRNNSLMHLEKMRLLDYQILF